MKEYEFEICLVDKELDIINDALSLYVKTMPFKKALFADTIREKFSEAIEDGTVRVG